MDDVNEAYKLAQEILKSKEILYQTSSQGHLDSQFKQSEDRVSNHDSSPILDTQSSQESQSFSDLPVVHPRPRKKRRTKVENLKIDWKGWNYVADHPNIVTFVNNSFQESKDAMFGAAAADKSLNESGYGQHSIAYTNNL